MATKFHPDNAHVNWYMLANFLAIETLQCSFTDQNNILSFGRKINSSSGITLKHGTLADIAKILTVLPVKFQYNWVVGCKVMG